MYTLHELLSYYKCTGDLLGSREPSTCTSDPTSVEETMFVYYPDRLPSQRQLHYQLCDIRDDQLQEIIHSNDGREKECTVCTKCVCVCVCVCVRERERERERGSVYN